jgi:hypothetical protein
VYLLLIAIVVFAAAAGVAAGIAATADVSRSKHNIELHGVHHQGVSSISSVCAYCDSADADRPLDCSRRRFMCSM